MIRVIRNKIRRVFSKAFLALVLISTVCSVLLLIDQQGWFHSAWTTDLRKDVYSDILQKAALSLENSQINRQDLGASNQQRSANETLSGKLIQRIIAASQEDLFLANWRSTVSEQCGGRFAGYANEMAVLRDVIVDRRLVQADRTGGEPLESVMNQAENVEYVSLDPGFFELSGCESSVRYEFNGEQNVLNNYVRAIRTSSGGESSRRTHWEKSEKRNSSSRWTRGTVNSVRMDSERGIPVVEGTVLLITRYEYVNLYHTMTDWFNAFLSLVMLNVDRSDAQVLLLDAHPAGSLDSAWQALFLNAFRLSDLPADRVLFRRLVFVTWGYNSPMSIASSHVLNVPLTDMFRLYVLSALKLVRFDRPLVDSLVHVRKAVPDRDQLARLVDEAIGAYTPDCNRLCLTLILRHPYIAHPRNPSGRLSRQIANERELLTFLRERYTSITSSVNGTDHLTSFTLGPNIEPESEPEPEPEPEPAQTLRTTPLHVRSTRRPASTLTKRERSRSKRASRKLAAAADLHAGLDNQDLPFAQPHQHLNALGKFSEIHAVQLDRLSFREQLALVSRTSVLVGMHGAALTHALFVPRFASVIELSPAYSGQQDHFYKLCESRRVHYDRWLNINYRFEVADSLTYVPTYELRRLVDGALENLRCVAHDYDV